MIEIILLLIAIFVNLLLITHNFIMRLKVKEQVKALLSQEGVTQKELVVMLNDLSAREYTTTNLSQRLARGSFSYNEVMQVAELLGYDVQFVKEKHI